MIEKIDTHNAYYYITPRLLADKINEIIDFLNASDLMPKPNATIPIENCTFVTGLCAAEDLTVKDIDNDELKCKDGQWVIPANHIVGGVVSGHSIDATSNPLRDCGVIHMSSDTKCPHCGESYYTEMYSTSTAVYYPPIYKDGVNINPDRNTTTRHCQCLSCGKEFTI